VVDDDPVFRDALCHVLSGDPGILVVGQADDGARAVSSTPSSPERTGTS
jgi:chemotaxis response regulator CheB